VAVLCSEENPANCHRHLLIARVLRDRGVAITHIRSDGSTQSEEELEAANVDGSQQGPLFDHAEDKRWRSLRSVSRRRAPVSSSDY
jgi:hypothetical protein